MIWDTSRLKFEADLLKIQGASRTMFNHSVPHSNQGVDNTLGQLSHITSIVFGFLQGLLAKLTIQMNRCYDTPGYSQV